jgi:hypothetical protein
MQNLLYQLLQKCPELIPLASAQRWEADKDSVTHTSVWTRKELAASLEKIMAQGQLTSRFCFFIDGLDEYADEGAGEHHELVEYLDLLAQSDQVKLCVSSRPWIVFKDRYEGRTDLTFVLQDLTSRDVQRYVEGMLNHDDRFRHLVLREPQAFGLVDQIRDRAEGVFLWVYLVVRSLLKGLSEHDDTAELERRLSAIPNDLNQYFVKIFANIDSVYRREAMRAFQLATVAMPLPLLAFTHIPREALSPRYAFETPATELKASNAKAKDNVNKWCRDLLEVQIHHDRGKLVETVSFLHRTVKDFLLTREMQTHFKEHPVCQSSPLRAMCMMFFVETKFLAGYRSLDEYVEFNNNATELMRWALECEKTEGDTPTEMLDEFGRLRSRSLRKEPDRDYRDRTPVEAPKTALQYAVMEGLCLYVGQCLDRDPSSKEHLLWFAAPLHKNSVRRETSDMLAMIILLLRNGVDPNQAWIYQASPSGDTDRTPANPDKTTWEVFLRACYKGSIENRRIGTLRHFAEPWIRYGADINTKFTMGKRRLDVRTCLLTRFGHWEGRTKGECEREVDAWLAGARARHASKLLANSSEPSKRPSLRAKFKRLLAHKRIIRDMTRPPGLGYANRIFRRTSFGSYSSSVTHSEEESDDIDAVQLSDGMHVLTSP